MLSPLVFANTLIKKALEDGESMTPLKIQKMLYILYAKYYNKYDAPLFADQFEKWPYGPVLSEVYDAFKQFGSRNINDFHYEANNVVSVVSRNNTNFYDCLNEVWGKYGRETGIELSKITHKDGGAWSKVEEEGDFLKLEDIKKDGEWLF